MDHAPDTTPEPAVDLPALYRALTGLAKAAREGADPRDVLAEITTILRGSTADAAVAGKPLVEIQWAGDIWDDEATKVIPTIGRRADGHCLIYPGKAHTIAGEPGSGKSWAALAVVRQVLLDGGTVLFADWDAQAVEVVGRLKSLGMTRDQAARFAHLRVDTSRLAASMAGLLALVGEHRPDLVVLDGQGAAMAAANLHENDNGDAARWHRLVVVPITDAGSATLTIDHVSKATANGDSASAYARGASAKLADVTGAAYLLQTVRPFAKNQAGAAKMIVMKDRHGQVGVKKETVAYITYIPTEARDEGLDVTLQVPKTAEDFEAALRTRIYRFVEHEGEAKKGEIANYIGGKRKACLDAVAALIDAGYLAVEKRGTAQLVSVTDRKFESAVHPAAGAAIDY